jgi:hypothetical protein
VAEWVGMWGGKGQGTDGSLQVADIRQVKICHYWRYIVNSKVLFRMGSFCLIGELR